MLDLGVRLQLMIGPTVPLPAPYPVIEALISVEVKNRDQERDAFQMTFSLGKDSPLDYSLLLSGLFDPPSRVIISTIINALPQPLIDGIITSHQIVPSNRPGESQLIVTGEDITLKLDLEEKSETYPNQPDSAIVTRLLLGYGLIPVVTFTPDIPIELQRITSQQETDLAFIQRLARRNGFVFYIEPGFTPFTTRAYWGLDNRLGQPQSALTMNMGPNTNVDQPIHFSFNALGPAAPQITIVEPVTKLPITIPLPSGLQPPLASRPATPLRKTLPRNTANLNPAQAALRGVSASSQSSDAVTATGEVDAVRYGRALRSRQLVGVRGVGFSYDGNYYVKEVTHQIQRGQYQQRFTLTREGRGALTPAVIP
ncbi:MAG TPA: hypothetical protein V6D10_01220 [Trichocoleus sp.]|jgi:hypothetical protein